MIALAAAPAFAVMALLTYVSGDPCSAGGMVPMYVLMSLFHSAPWMNLVNKRRGRAYLM